MSGSRYATLGGLAGVTAEAFKQSGPVAPDSIDLWPALRAGTESPRTELVININVGRGSFSTRRALRLANPTIITITGQLEWRTKNWELEALTRTSERSLSRDGHLEHRDALGRLDPEATALRWRCVPVCRTAVPLRGRRRDCEPPRYR